MEEVSIPDYRPVEAAGSDMGDIEW
ncbi:MAG: hypothetical protein QOG84_779, partial [Sphingomonadales bacterium]|nr:hypothetical protein [Sphingomonadales bacterium]